MVNCPEKYGRRPNYGITQYIPTGIACHYPWSTYTYMER
jgi:hypothetical protein